MSTGTQTLHPALPVADELSAPFWEGARNSSLLLLDAAQGSL